MFLVIGLNSKPVQKEEIIQVEPDFKLEKFKTRQKKQAFEMALKKASEPKLVSYAFFM